MRVKGCAVILKDQSILLVEFHDENGLHYNLPGGGVEPGETIMEAVVREAKEEASIDIEVGELAFIYEYAPHRNNHKYGKTHSLSLMFECKIINGTTPELPQKPDLHQTDVKWIPLAKLNDVILYPNIKEQLLAYADQKIKLCF
ncbi:ADP-ribose pyrophosphatase YjhB (NUDIX family) [Metabacillus malikii]|uniref:ADP-ribose pyrophosphatase YjhB (NUDIX family) n=2 Tax=Metabacillus malikii TaxID=1504265 RepID=A0ABT9ZCD9_9BACI|nr:ADP-ribose pyrophosphatase YjhB (NUDIX family) [Metabacillus malikii]